MTRTVMLVALWVVHSISAGAAPAAYTFGIGPVQSSTELARRWVPVMRYLSRATGYQLTFQTARNISTFQDDMVAGTFDFAFINPYHYVQSHASMGYEAFAREKNGSLVGIVVVRKDSVMTDLAQLERQTIAFPGPTALAATWLPLTSLRDRRIAVRPQYVNSMDSVYLAVARGLFPAGGGELRTFNAVAPEIRDQLRIIWRAEPMPPFAFVAHPRVPKLVVDKVRAAMVAMNTRPEAMALLRVIHLAGVEQAGDADYDGFRKLSMVAPPEAAE